MENIQEKIAGRAFELFAARGGQHGYHIQDWLQAEKEIMDTSITSKKKSAAPAKDVEEVPVKAPAKEKKPAAPKVKAEKAAPAKKAAAKK